MTGVTLPSYIPTNSPQIAPGAPKVGEIAVLWDSYHSLWHFGITQATTTEGFWMASTNAHGCGLSLDYFKYSDTRYSGKWISESSFADKLIPFI